MSVQAPPQVGADAQPTGKRKIPLTERAKAERKLGWMLCAPAVVLMLLVTAYPIIYAIVLSLREVDLRFPDEGGFAGLDNYIAVLSSGLSGLIAVTGCTPRWMPRDRSW